ncbi:hypothetical protein T1E_5448 [Pseudomonas putida DOT-T1E]|uniref:Uncharacterized protein n=1 Tax=Pseudomonas putida (strain DOT-T1E) TaxID=1196325 RepID=I7CHB2_PSEPT|nr:hypothetical protein T1E_5448 [Pseudomonas putida DOT-T1E]
MKILLLLISRVERFSRPHEAIHGYCELPRRIIEVTPKYHAETLCP